MKHRTIAFLATSIIGASFVAGYVANLAFSSPQGPIAGAAAPASTAGSRAALSAASSATTLDATVEAAYMTARKSVVYVNNPGSGTGSGVIYDSSGDIVTNAHVTSGGHGFRVTLWNGKTAPATLVGTDSADDLAVIHVTTSQSLTPATFASHGSYQVAQPVLAIGSPIGLKDSVTFGLISGVNRVEQEPNGAYIPNAIQTSAPINPGNSGGALVALNGDVVGIPTMVQTSTTGNEPVQNVGFAIPSSRVTYIVNQIVSTGHVQHTGRAFLGVVPSDSSGGGGFSFNGYGGGTSGALLTSVQSSGPAGQAGLKTGDIITRFNNTRITGSSDLLAALATQKPGTTARVTFDRSGSTHTANVVLGEMPASG